MNSESSHADAIKLYLEHAKHVGLADGKFHLAKGQRERLGFEELSAGWAESPFGILWRSFTGLSPCNYLRINTEQPVQTKNQAPWTSNACVGKPQDEGHKIEELPNAAANVSEPKKTTPHSSTPHFICASQDEDPKAKPPEVESSLC